MEKTFREIIKFIREVHNEPNGAIPLHSPVFLGNEKKYLNDCIDSTFVSYVGKYVTQFEDRVASYLGVEHAVAVINGTAALQVSLQLAGVKKDDEVLTQALSFVATANAISHCGATPVFIDSELENLGMDPGMLEEFLDSETTINDDGNVYNKKTGKKISACCPVHIFGHPARIEDILRICNKYQIPVVEDSAESIGSTYRNRSMGTYGLLGVLSFNGNKTITTGGGGMILTNSSELAIRARHITTTAKIPHKWEFFHDEVAYNYRLPNINAAIGCAQMELIDKYLENKRELASEYSDYFKQIGVNFFNEKQYCKSNYWLNVIFFENRIERDLFLDFSNSSGVMTRPAWTLLNKLPMYNNCVATDLYKAQLLEDRIVNIPSSVRLKNS